MPAYLPPRIAALRQALARQHADAFLLTHPTDLAYFTDFEGEDSLALVTERGLTILTDFRFDEQAEIEAPWFRRVIRKGLMQKTLARELKRIDAKRVLFEGGYWTIGARDTIKQELKEKKLRKVRFKSVSGVTANIRKIKDQHEIGIIRQAVSLAEDAFTAVRAEIRPGVTENYLTGLMELKTRTLGALGMGFQTIVCAGANASLCHYRPGNVPVLPNEVLLIDWGVKYKGYTSDMTRTLMVGKVNGRLREVYEIVREAQQVAIDRIRPGASTRQIDLAGRKLIRKAGFGKYFGHSIGHGIGRLVHEVPSMRSTPGAVEEELKPGMIVTVEPGIYLPGEGGVRIEDDVLVTETGHEVLGRLPKDIDWAQV